jgi:hypothetical protein
MSYNSRFTRAAFHDIDIEGFGKAALVTAV